MNKKAKFIVSILLALDIVAWADPILYQTPYNPEQCIQGAPGRWTGACACDDVTQAAGRYCDQPAGSLCETNEQCQKNEYCLYPPKRTIGVCHQIVHYPKVTKGWLFWKKSYILSGELMNWPSAQSFCRAIGGRSVTRADFNCNSMGVGCLNFDLLLTIRPDNGLGFFWLDENEKKDNLAYYADFNDGIVYSFKKSSAAVTQALCVLEKNK